MLASKSIYNFTLQLMLTYFTLQYFTRHCYVCKHAVQ